MITLENAIRLANNHLNDENLTVRNDCRDLGDFWVFDWGRKENINEIKSDSIAIKVEKETGATSDFYIGVPGMENFHKYFYAPKVDISGYIR